jgi:hypothetical protein
VSGQGILMDAGQMGASGPCSGSFQQDIGNMGLSTSNSTGETWGQAAISKGVTTGVQSGIQMGCGPAQGMQAGGLTAGGLGGAIAVSGPCNGLVAAGTLTGIDADVLQAASAGPGGMVAQQYGQGAQNTQVAMAGNADGIATAASSTAIMQVGSQTVIGNGIAAQETSVGTLSGAAGAAL